MIETIAQPDLETEANPILRWLFKQDWEDPNWGHLPVNQVALGLILHDLSSKLADATLKQEVQEIAQKIVIKNARPIELKK